MTGMTTAYSTLGLQPGADREAIDAAYKKLIKRYHPDRSGGDAQRAAEINRAYRELRGSTGQPAEKAAPSSIAEAIYQRRAQRVRTKARRKPRRRWALVLLLAVCALLFLQRQHVGSLAMQVRDMITGVVQPQVAFGEGPVPAQPDLIEHPLAANAIQGAIHDAMRIGPDDEDGLADQSRDCHRQMRLAPSAEQLDRCAAFDDAVVALHDSDPVHDGGPFSASAVTSRQMAAATLLSNDYLAIESRLDRVRSLVEATLSQPAAPAPTSQTVRTRRPGR